MGKVHNIMKEVTEQFSVFGHLINPSTPQNDIPKTPFDRKRRAKNINSGRCMIWAYRMYTRLPGSEIWITDRYGHVFIKYRGRFYDSESKYGAKVWQKLEIFKNFTMKMNDACFVTVEQLVDKTHEWNSGVSYEVYGSYAKRAA